MVINITPRIAKTARKVPGCLVDGGWLGTPYRSSGIDLNTTWCVRACDGRVGARRELDYELIRRKIATIHPYSAVCSTVAAHLRGKPVA